MYSILQYVFQFESYIICIVFWNIEIKKGFLIMKAKKVMLDYLASAIFLQIKFACSKTVSTAFFCLSGG